MNSPSTATSSLRERDNLHQPQCFLSGAGGGVRAGGAAFGAGAGCGFSACCGLPTGSLWRRLFSCWGLSGRPGSVLSIAFCCSSKLGRGSGGTALLNSGRVGKAPFTTGEGGSIRSTLRPGSGCRTAEGRGGAGRVVAGCRVSGCARTPSVGWRVTGAAIGAATGPEGRTTG